MPGTWDSIERGGKAHIWAGMQDNNCRAPGTCDVSPEKGEQFRPTCANVGWSRVEERRGTYNATLVDLRGMCEGVGRDAREEGEVTSEAGRREERREQGRKGR